MNIIITGPECSGKTTLAKGVAAQLAAPMVSEYARDYLLPGRRYDFADLEHITNKQIENATEALRLGSKHVVYDTFLYVLAIWGMIRFGRAPHQTRHAGNWPAKTVYLLCTPDLKWHQDGLRENPTDRHVLFDLYQRALINGGRPFCVIIGQGPERLDRAMKFLDIYIN